MDEYLQADMQNAYGIVQVDSKLMSVAMSNASNLLRCLSGGMSNAPSPRLARALRIAAEVRARHPEMQVKRCSQ